MYSTRKRKPDKPLLELGNHLRELREGRGMTQQQLGRKSGVGNANISRYETGEREPPLVAVARICRALDYEVEWHFYSLRDGEQA